MAVPAFLNSSFRYFNRSGVSDVQTIMDDFAAEVAANSPAWTNPSAGLYQSPVDGDGRFFDVLLTRVTQYKLEWRVRDQLANTLCTRRINCPSANNWNVHIYTGQYHAVIDVEMGSAAPEALAAGILDLSPESQTVHTHYCYGAGSRSNADSLSGNDWSSNFMIDNATAASAQRVPNSITSGNLGFTLTLSGYRMYIPYNMWVQPSGGGNYKYAGRAYQHLMGDKDQANMGTPLTIPLDTGTTGVFRPIGGRITVASSLKLLYVRSA